MQRVGLSAASFTDENPLNGGIAIAPAPTNTATQNSGPGYSAVDNSTTPVQAPGFPSYTVADLIAADFGSLALKLMAANQVYGDKTCIIKPGDVLKLDDKGKDDFIKAVKKIEKNKVDAVEKVKKAEQKAAAKIENKSSRAAWAQWFKRRSLGITLITGVTTAASGGLIAAFSTNPTAGAIVAAVGGVITVFGGLLTGYLRNPDSFA